MTKTILTAAETQDSSRLNTWYWALFYSLPVSILVILLFVYWFGIADRSIVFLYFHDMGPLVPDTAPFSFVTSSRYWMAGLVASGAVLVLYGGVNVLIGRLSSDYRPPSWPRVWVFCAISLIVAIPLITMTLNRPVLPPFFAAQTTVATLTGLVAALIPGDMAARRPTDLLLLALDGVGLMLVLTTVIGLEYLGRWLSSGTIFYLALMVFSILAGVIWLLVMTAIRWWRRLSIPSAGAVFLAGWIVTYLFMPLLHHVGFTDGYFYITDADNFFARNGYLQLSAWILAAGLAWVITKIREFLATRRPAPAA